MKVKDLQEKHKDYEYNFANWELYRKAYDGGFDFIEYALHKLERETTSRHEERLAEGIYLNYAAAIVDMFNFYLTEQAPIRHFDALNSNKQWIKFLADADYNGTDFAMYINNTQRLSSIYGTIGVLVNKHHNPNLRSLQDELVNGVYPYCCSYTPTNIWDWGYEKNKESGRMKLNYLKLREADGKITVWSEHDYRTYEIDDKKKQGSDDVVLVESGINPLGEIPFVWMPNIKNLYTPYLGISDLKDVAIIAASIVRNLSHGEEVIKFAGFPMLRLPQEADDGTGTDDGNGQEEVAVRTVLEFDPESPDAQPSWMETQIAEPIEAVVKWIDRKVDELYRVAHLSGIHSQRRSNNKVESGLAMRYEFQQLNSVLLQKNANMAEAEMGIIRLWLKWQESENLIEQVQIDRNKNFSVDDLSVNLENIYRSISEIPSKTFAMLSRKKIIKLVLPDIADMDYKKITTELESAETKDDGKVVKPSESEEPTDKDEGAADEKESDDNPPSQ